MISRVVDERSTSVMPEEPDDLLALRRIIRAGDTVAGSTTRVIKRDRDYSRPDRGERVRVSIAVRVESISLDAVLDRLRVRGTIVRSDNESVPNGSHHSLLIQIGETVTVAKSWSAVDRRLLGPGSTAGFVLVAVDAAECGVARLRGTHLHVIPNIYSGAGGKAYKTSFKPEAFFADVLRGMDGVIRQGDDIILFGPGETKRRFANHLQRHRPGKYAVRIVEGIDSGGEDGIYIFTRSDIMREIISDSKLAAVSRIIDEVMSMAGRGGARFSMGYEETRAANCLGAIDCIVFSERIIQDVDEQAVVDLLNDAESRGAVTYSVDSSTDMGLRVTGLGGMVALLRFAVRA